MRRLVTLVVVAAAGLAAAVGVTVAATAITDQEIGLDSEPLTAGRELAPSQADRPARTFPARTTTAPRTTPEPRPTGTTTVPATPPATTPEVEDESDGDSGKGRGRGRGRGGDDDD